MTGESGEDPETWPSLRGLDAAGETERINLILGVLIDEEKARRRADDDEATSELALTQKMQDTLATVAVSGIDRARAGAQFVQTAAGAIGGFYTGILALIYVSDAQLPARGVIPTLFLGAAVALAAYYIAFIGSLRSWSRPMWTTIPNEDAWVRLNYVTTSTRSLAYARAGALRAGVVCLMFGLITLPIAIVTLPSLTVGLDPLIVELRESEVAAQLAPVVWPQPTILANSDLSVALYTAQLEEFREGLNTKPPLTDQAGQDRFAIAVAMIGLLAAALGWIVPAIWNRIRGEEIGPDEIPSPAAEA